MNKHSLALLWLYIVVLSSQLWDQHILLLFLLFLFALSVWYLPSTTTYLMILPVCPKFKAHCLCCCHDVGTPRFLIYRCFFFFMIYYFLYRQIGEPRCLLIWLKKLYLPKAHKYKQKEGLTRTQKFPVVCLDVHGRPSLSYWSWRAEVLSWRKHTYKPDETHMIKNQIE